MPTIFIVLYMYVFIIGIQVCVEVISNVNEKHCHLPERQGTVVW